MATSNLAVQNWFETTLSGAISSSDTTIGLNNVPTGTEGYLVIEPDNASNREVIYFTSKTGAAVICPSVGDGRGQDGTSAVSHSQGATVRMQVVAAYWEALQDGSGLNSGALSGTPFATGWVTSALPDVSSVTCNGNHSYDVTFDSTVAATLTPGMRLRLSRTVAAPTQCTDLESSSSQYYSKSSPSGMTFTDDFVVSAWVKLEGYTNMIIASRYNGTSGWYLNVTATGQVVVNGINGGSGNFSLVQSYQSLPLNKWVHIAGQLDMSAFTATTTTSYIMIDGVDVPAFVSRAGTNPTALIQAGNLEIGAFNGGTLTADAKIAQVAIYSAKVTQANIRATISQGLSGSETSLISAYSFNNSINDLSANANNLTANGSAVATNADSPFALDANGTPGGTYEWGIVTSVSTTTARVITPHGSAIPTSGGVSAVALSTSASPFGFPQVGQILGSAIRTSDFTTTSATATQVLGLTVTLDIPAIYVGKDLLISLSAGEFSNTGVSVSRASIWSGVVASGTQLASGDIDSYVGTAGAPLFIQAQFVPQAAGSFTFNAGLLAGANTATIAASAVNPMRLTVVAPYI